MTTTKEQAEDILLIEDVKKQVAKSINKAKDPQIKDFLTKLVSDVDAYYSTVVSQFLKKVTKDEK